MMLLAVGQQTGDTVISGVPLFPSSSSAMSGRVDTLFWFLFSLTGALSLAIFIVIVVFAIKYRRRAPNEIGAPIAGSALAETIWIVVPLLIFLFMFAWGAKLYFQVEHPPAQAMQIYVVGKQWMWKLQHPEGRVEIDQLHVPVGRDVTLIMTSEDVIHDFYVPAFRAHEDVLPGRYTSLSFRATQTGTFHLFCSQYCGTDHSLMAGWVTVMNPSDFESWLAAGTEQKPMAQTGEELFQQYNCVVCHDPSGKGKGPSLLNLYGSQVRLQDGQTVTVNDSYLRVCILTPATQRIVDYPPDMPSFQGQLSEQQIADLVAYIKSLSGPEQQPKGKHFHEPIRGAREDAMSTAPAETAVRENYLNAGYGVWSWLLTTDHKRIALLYLASVTFYFFLGGLFAVLMRLNLLSPEGALVSAATYNKLFSMHGITMVWFFLIPSIPAVLGNFLIPLMIGAKDVAFPKLNLASWYIFNLGGICLLYCFVTGGVDTGWTFYTPLSSLYLNTHVVSALLAVFITGFSSILTGLNFIVTTHTMRAPGMTWGRLPLFVWALYATSVILVLATPVLAITVSLVAVERVLHIGIFDPSLGGDPLLFQHLFWFYSHPAVYVMVLPGMGVVSEIIPTFSRKRLFGYYEVAAASIGIAVIGFFVWGHHMFVSGESPYSAMVFSILSYLVAVPSAIKVFNWLATMYKGSISWDTPMLYAMGFIALFVMGGMTGLFLAALGMDVHVHDTYFVIAHFHYIMVGGTVMAYMGGLHYWWPKISGRMYPEGLAKLAALILFLGFNLTFFPQYILGYMGMPRRYHAYPPEFQVLNVMSSAGASILAIGYLLPLFYLIWSMRYGPIAASNPWPATGLEWQTASPPTTHNFEETPTVTWEPYDFVNRPDLKYPAGPEDYAPSFR